MAPSLLDDVVDEEVFNTQKSIQMKECSGTGEFSGLLLGDKGYACETFLLTPPADPQTLAQLTTIPTPVQGLELK
ncbi:hypothetical protein QQF64_006254 [Cirrhinus molitorella]|uniref:Uncharacterized protein n=1 Tax=Cirrhinus molitorella TaxID=172907 RepID=A0ABR3MFX8_9TELE